MIPFVRLAKVNNFHGSLKSLNDCEGAVLTFLEKNLHYL